MTLINLNLTNIGIGQGEEQYFAPRRSEGPYQLTIQRCKMAPVQYAIQAFNGFMLLIEDTEVDLTDCNQFALIDAFARCDQGLYNRLTIRNSLLYNFMAKSGHTVLSLAGMGIMTVENNRFVNITNDQNNEIILFPMVNNCPYNPMTSSFIYTNNTFEGNSVNSYGMKIACFSDGGNTNLEEIIIRGNTFKNMVLLTEVFLMQTGYGQNIYFEDNHFVNVSVSSNFRFLNWVSQGASIVSFKNNYVENCSLGKGFFLSAESLTLSNFTGKNNYYEEFATKPSMLNVEYTDVATLDHIAFEGENFLQGGYVSLVSVGTLSLNNMHVTGTAFEKRPAFVISDVLNLSLNNLDFSHITGTTATYLFEYQSIILKKVNDVPADVSFALNNVTYAHGSPMFFKLDSVASILDPTDALPVIDF